MLRLLLVISVAVLHIQVTVVPVTQDQQPVTQAGWVQAIPAMQSSTVTTTLLDNGTVLQTTTIVIQ